MFKGEYVVENNKLYNMSTGEIIPDDEAEKILNNLAHESYREVASVAIEIGKKLDSRLIKDRRGNEFTSVKIKEEYEFVKVFTVSKREIKKSSNLSKVAKAAFFDMESEISFPTNTIVIDGKTPSIETLCEFLDLKKSKLYDVLKELENAEIIKRQKINGQLVIYINPYIYNRGYVDYDTVIMFKDSSYNPDNRK